MHCSDAFHWVLCALRQSGGHQRPQSYHSMLSATLVAAAHQRVLPLLAECVQPPQDPAAPQRDCARHAAQRWRPAHRAELRPHSRVLHGPDLDCCPPLCRLL